MSDARESQLLEQIARLERERAILQERIDQLLREKYGVRSEKMHPDQLQLLLQEAEVPGPAVGKSFGPEGEATPPPRPVRKARMRDPRRLPEHLPVLEEVIEPMQVQACPEAWRRIGEEVTERLGFEPARFFVQRTVRPKYVRRAEADALPVIAPLPACLLERGSATPGLLAQILTAKYVDHLPLYRQASIYRSRHGVTLTRQTMGEWVELAADWLRLIYEEIGERVTGNAYVQMDETPVRYLSPGAGKARLGYFWACHRPGGDVIFAWQTSRAASCLENILPGDFRGVIQCDGYRGYDAYSRTRPGEIILAGCWTHVRRKFVEALEHAPRKAALVVHLLQNLYRTEARLRRKRASPKLRRLVREQESRPVIERLRRILVHWRQKGGILPQSALGKAIEYAFAEWDSLLLYLQDGRVEIDTNLVENAIRPTALGKKNWLFIGEAEAGQRSAIIYTVVESCRRRGLDPFEYLRDVLDRLPSATTSQIKDLTPEAWAKGRVTLRAAA